MADSGEAVLRIHFSAGDLTRTRIAEEPDPLWEIVLSMHQLREPRRESVLDAWRGRQRPGDLSALRMLSPLMPPRGYFPDFLTPAAGLGGLECGIDAVLSTPRSQLRAEMALLAGQDRLPAWTRPLAVGDLEAVHRLGRALRRYYDAVLAPCWPRIAARVEADRRHRTSAQCRLGTEEMLRTFAPVLRWEPPVLVADYPAERDIHLEGRGLLLVPSYFCRRTPVALLDTALWPVLVYPARMPEPEAAVGPAPRLAPLLGHTRAAVLQALQEPCTTTELARLAGVSVSSASEHASVLRRAGLVASTRERHRMHHSLTRLGSHLLNGVLVG
ncbi:DUF5937 family protein [Streptomyces sp. NPDC006422]|uniref:ArsR/SmtB family transcription factor n=1 Tax=unclassified Streptomyces TaxID=2593676 RepID=UPI0033B40BF4